MTSMSRHNPSTSPPSTQVHNPCHAVIFLGANSGSVLIAARALPTLQDGPPPATVRGRGIAFRPETAGPGSGPRHPLRKLHTRDPSPPPPPSQTAAGIVHPHGRMAIARPVADANDTRSVAVATACESAVTSARHLAVLIMECGSERVFSLLWGILPRVR